MLLDMPLFLYSRVHAMLVDRAIVTHMAKAVVLLLQGRLLPT